jgi:hypothetical protein
MEVVALTWPLAPQQRPQAAFSLLHTVRLGLRTPGVPAPSAAARACYGGWLQDEPITGCTGTAEVEREL